MKKFLIPGLIFFYQIALYSQSITSVVPNEGEQGETLQVTITGSNTNWAQSSNTLSFKQSSSTIYPTSQTINSDTEITGLFHFQYYHITGLYDVAVEENTTGNEVVLEDGFQLNEGSPPQIISVDPDNGEQVSALTVTITGESTYFTQGSPVVFFQASNISIFPVSQTILSDTQMECDYLLNPGYPTGLYDVKLFAEPVVLEDGFEVTAASVFPELTGLVPDSAEQGETVSLTVSGTDTHFNHDQVTNDVYLTSQNGNLYSYNIEAINDTTLEADFTFEYYHLTGSYGLFLYNQLDGVMNLESAFTLEEGPDAPAISSVVPDTAMQTEEVWINVTGENVDFNQGTVTLYLHQPNGTIIYPAEQNVLNDTVLEGDFFFNPDQNTGFYDVIIDNTLAFLEDGFYLLPPQAPPGEPSNEPITGGQDEPVILTVTVENAHFDHPDLEIIVSLLLNRDEGIFADNVVVIDSNVIEAEFNFTSDSEPGLYGLNVFNQLDGTMWLEDAFTLEGENPSQSIVSVNPDKANQGESLWITITGQNTSFTSGTATIKLIQGTNTVIVPVDENVLNDTLIEGNFMFTSVDPIGNYDVYVYDLGESWSFDKQDGFYLDKYVSIGENVKTTIGRLYPNPVTDVLFIERDNIIEAIAVEILNLNGEVVYRNDFVSDRQILQLGISNFESGIYLLKLKSGDKIQIEKFVVR